MALSEIIPLVATADINDSQFDSVVVVIDSPENLITGSPDLAKVKVNITKYIQINKSQSASVIPCSDIPSGRLIYSPTGPVTRDYDDVRRYKDAAVAAAKMVVSSGSRAPLLIGPTHTRYPLAARVTFLGALQQLYTPIEVREFVSTSTRKVDKIGIFSQTDNETSIIKAIESGRFVCRDIHGSDPERMAPPRVAQYVKDVFAGTCISVTIVDGHDTLEKEYPLMAAVNRGCRNIPRHHGCVINLEYKGEGPIEKTLMLVGKGVTMDTGGVNVKVGGAMVGMNRDKGGAGAVAGFFQVLSMLKPKGLKVVGAMTMVRNSIGAEAYVCDEIITSRAGVRVRIINTDAEGRMAMGDVLCHMKEKAANEVNPHLFTIATLTGHVIRAYGPNYTSVNCNGPAVAAGTPTTLNDAGAKSADPFEISTLRREDYEAHSAQSEYEDVVQSQNQPSTQSPRGHQSPMAFLVMASGLDKHGGDSDQPLPYAHLDIAGSSGDLPDAPTGAPITALTHAYVLDRIAKTA